MQSSGHVAGRIDLDCIDDEDAKRQAEMLVDPFGLELWEDDRMAALVGKRVTELYSKSADVLTDDFAPADLYRVTSIGVPERQ
jgi:hypothetical protein